VTISPLDDSTTTSPVDDDDEGEGGSCEKIYGEQLNSKKLLMVMAYGIKVRNCNIGDTEVPPYSTSRNRKGITPASAMLIEEVTRRCIATNRAPVKCKSYPKPKLLSWLIKNPVDNPADVEFLTKEVATLHKQIAEAAQEKVDMLAKEATKKSPWLTSAPFLRLYHCLLHDEVKKAFLKKDDARNRQQVDGMKSTKRAPTYEELVTELFNDPAFQPTSLSLEHLHVEFADEFILDFDTMPGRITAEEVKTRLADSRAKLVIVSISRACTICLGYLSNPFLFYKQKQKVINNWEMSGNGFGQRPEGDECFGALDDQHLLDGDNRQSFLGGFRPMFYITGILWTTMIS
jgi:hypothetical protein